MTVSSRTLDGDCWIQKDIADSRGAPSGLAKSSPSLGRAVCAWGEA